MGEEAQRKVLRLGDKFGAHGPVVLITVNGQWVWMPVVNVWRPDLWNFFRRSIDEHSGWSGAIDAAPGTHSVCAHVADAVTANEFRVIDCKNAVVK